MKALISGAKCTIFIFLIIFSCHARAEHYVQCCEQPATVVYITCRNHHCAWSSQPTTHHYSHIRYHHYVRHHHPIKYTHYQHRHYRYIDRYTDDTCCDQDMATGDDNACDYPEMQIN
jgi:hypothetical protein